MGKRGPPAKPTALKRAQGNPGKRALNRHEPQPRALAGDELMPPPRVAESRLALEAWTELAPELRRLGLLTVADVHALTEYCRAYADRWTLQDEMQNMTAGEAIATGLVKHRDNAIRRLKEWGARFGLSPADRARLNTVPPEDKDVAAQQAFLRGAS